MEPTNVIADLPLPPPSTGEIKIVEENDRRLGAVEETRAAIEPTDPLTPEDTVIPPPAPPVEVKENRWKLAFRQLMFMKGMNMQVNDRNKNEIELRQHNITPISLMCSVPYFNSFSSKQIQSLVEASQRAQLRPGDTLPLEPAEGLCDKCLFIVSSGNLAIASVDVDNARAIQQANLSPKFKLGVGDYFAPHQVTTLKVIAMEPVQYLMLRMDVIANISESAVREIEADQCDACGETAETASFKQWALQYTLAMQRPSIGESVSSAVPKGLAKSTLKQFSKDFLLHFSPENELDHTLEYMKLTLMAVFKARRVRVFIIDNDSKKILIKFSDDPLSQSVFELQHSIAEKVIDKRAAVFIPSVTPYLEGDGASELYKPSDRVIATPIFKFDHIHVSTSGDVAPVVAVLEVVMDCASTADTERPNVDREASENDMLILEVAAQELSRYLFFHYQDFFAIALKSGTDETAPVTEVFPAPDVTGSEEKISLTLNQLALTTAEANASHVVVSICHGKMCLVTKKTGVRPGSPSKDKSAPRTYLFDAAVDLEVSLADIPHGSHLLIQVYTKKGPIAWSGVHLFDFGHGLRTGTFDLDVSNALVGCVTALDIENCAKTNRPNKTSVIGSLRLCLECTGAALGFSFSSMSHKPKRSITYRASIFGERKDSRFARESQVGVDSYETKMQKLLIRLRGDPLVHLSPADREFVWDSRITLADDSALLPAFLLSVDWSKRYQVMEAYRMLILWRQPTYLQALQLLSPMFPDPKVRAYAVRCMHSLPDHRLRLYLLQLVQALKNERYHDSALARFLIMRALQNPAEIGYSLYWFLKAEVHVDQTAERFGLIMGEYMQLCGSYKLEIRQSVFVMKKLEEIARVVKTEPTRAARRAKLHKELLATVLPDTFQLPLHPRAYCKGIIVEPCRVMESKKRPLFLQLASTKEKHGNPFVIFKSGDDLRQDQLVLQILRVMDDLWREAGLDLCLSPYACISTGNEIGLIEVVGDSSTLATIIYDRHQGSWSKLSRKFKSAKDALVGHHVISEWLFAEESEEKANRRSSTGEVQIRQHADSFDPSSPSSVNDIASPVGSPRNRPASKSGAAISEAEGSTPSPCFSPLSPLSLLRTPKKSFSRDEDAMQNFLRSCAGYCVATYVLGIGDRHNDNIMLQRSGKFFHIDFGHFLGNFKSKFGIKREKAPFVLTPAMIHVIDVDGSGNFDKFKDLACDAFHILRTNSNLLITLLVLALTCGTPELTSEDDIKWVHSTLMLDLSDDDAGKKFRKLIHVALHTKTTRVNDAVHLMAH